MMRHYIWVCQISHVNVGLLTIYYVCLRFHVTRRSGIINLGKVYSSLSSPNLILSWNVAHTQFYPMKHFVSWKLFNYQNWARFPFNCPRGHTMTQWNHKIDWMREQRSWSFFTLPLSAELLFEIDQSRILISNYDLLHVKN